MKAARSPVLPDDVRGMLEKVPQAWAAYRALSPSHQREYLRWLEEARKADTRARRIHARIDRLMRPRP
jgi:uncharacterized protein YdeI (YjbR/CyaY-like superfamily)